MRQLQGPRLGWKVTYPPMHLCRLTKEKNMYEKEVVDQQAKVEKMKSDKKDEYDIRKQVCCHSFIPFPARLDVFLCCTARKRCCRNQEIWSLIVREDWMQLSQSCNLWR